MLRKVNAIWLVLASSLISSMTVYAAPGMGLQPSMLNPSVTSGLNSNLNLNTTTQQGLANDQKIASTVQQALSSLGANTTTRTTQSSADETSLQTTNAPNSTTANNSIPCTTGNMPTINSTTLCSNDSNAAASKSNNDDTFNLCPDNANGTWTGQTSKFDGKTLYVMQTSQGCKYLSTTSTPNLDAAKAVQ